MDIHRARALRKNSTDAERALWHYLRLRQRQGYKFRRQQPLGHYIVDFVCFEQKLIIEVDGGQHAEQNDADSKRTEDLVAQGFRVTRFWNHEVLQNAEGIIAAIDRMLMIPPT